MSICSFSFFGRDVRSKLENQYNVEYMFRTNSTFTLLQALTAVVTFAIILWFVGVPSFRAEAANVTSFSNTLSPLSHQLVSPQARLSQSTLVQLAFQELVLWSRRIST